MLASVPHYVLYKISNHKEVFKQPRSDGRQVLPGFTSQAKALEYCQTAGLADEWEPAPFSPTNLLTWLPDEPPSELLALDPDNPEGELQAIEVERAVCAIKSQSAEDDVWIEYEQFPAIQHSA